MKFQPGDTVRHRSGKDGTVVDYARGVDRYLVRLRGKEKRETIMKPENMILVKSAPLQENE
jgi:hypothetical protein